MSTTNTKITKTDKKLWKLEAMLRSPHARSRLTHDQQLATWREIQAIKAARGSRPTSKRRTHRPTRITDHERGMTGVAVHLPGHEIATNVEIWTGSVRSSRTGRMFTKPQYDQSGGGKMHGTNGPVTWRVQCELCGEYDHGRNHCPSWCPHCRREHDRRTCELHRFGTDE